MSSCSDAYQSGRTTVKPNNTGHLHWRLLTAQLSDNNERFDYSMKHFPPSWKEGMFLLPHHFQQSETFDAEQLALSSRFDHPYGYGFHALEIDEVAFENWQLAIRRASGRCKDGTIFDVSVTLSPVKDSEGNVLAVVQNA